MRNLPFTSPLKRGLIFSKLKSPAINLNTITSLELSHSSLTDEYIGLIMQYLTTPFLTSLSLEDTSIRDQSIKCLAQNINLQNLTSLNLKSNRFTYEGIRYLTESSILLNLTSLNLENSFFNKGIGDIGAIYLSESPNLLHLTYLDLQHNNIGTYGIYFLNVEFQGAFHLSKSSTLTNLRTLDLENSLNKYGGGQIENFEYDHQSQTFLYNLLASKKISLEEIHDIVADIEHRIEYTIGGSRNRGAEYISQSTTLTNLTRLNLYKNRISKEVASRIKQSSSLTNLLYTGLTDESDDEYDSLTGANFRRLSSNLK